MPGIFGIFDPERTIALEDRMRAMGERMRFEPVYREESFIAASDGIGIGRMSLGCMSPEVQPVKAEPEGLVGIMEGELYSGGDADAPSDAARVLRAFAQGPEALKALNGTFVAAVWRGLDRSLTLINDRFGMRPVYYAVVSGRLLFSSNLAALLVDPQLSRAPSKAGIAQFLTYGQYMADDTSLEAVQVLPAGCTLRFDAATGEVSISRYAVASATSATFSDAQWTAAIADAFETAVTRRAEKAGALGIALSGGLDARTILALIDQQRTPITAICYSMRGSLDHRCSEHMSQIAGNPYHHYELGTEFLADYRRHLERMVVLTDGQYLSQCIVMPTLPLYREHGIDVLMRGHAGELMHMHKAYAYTLDEEALAAPSSDAVEQWLSRHLQAYMLDSVEGTLLRPEYQTVLESAPREVLGRVLAGCAPADPPVQAVWELFISQRLRRETSLSMAKFSSTVDIRLPYLDNDLIDLLLGAPPSIKMGDTIQRHILKTRRPEFLDVINANTGARMGAPVAVQRLMTLKKRVLGKLGVPGYQPYERLGLWLRREIAPTVREILLSDQCKDRGIFEPATLERVVQDHLQGRTNSTYLLMALMIIELGQRHLNEEEGFGVDAHRRAA